MTKREKVYQKFGLVTETNNEVKFYFELKD